MEPGVYVGMPEAQYHAIPALSSSGMKWLSVSPMDFWARSWLNPNREDEQESEFTELGSAYHARILEGHEAFYQRYAVALDPSAYPDALRTADEFRAALKSAGQKISGSKAELRARLLSVQPDAIVWDDIEADYAAQHPGKTFLSAETIARIEVAAAMIEKHPHLSKAFTGGYPEITVIWNDEESGVLLKARLDYLKPKCVVDLKTFSNPLNKPVDQAIYQAIASRKYYLQAVHYRAAVAAIPGLVSEGRVFGPADSAWLAKVSPDPEWLWVFQQTGVAPLARGRLWPGGLMRGAAEVARRQAIDLFKQCFDAFGADPWVDQMPIEPLDDTGFPAWTFQ